MFRYVLEHFVDLTVYMVQKVSSINYSFHLLISATLPKKIIPLRWTPA